MMSDGMHPLRGEPAPCHRVRRLLSGQGARWSWLVVGLTVLSLAWVKTCTPVEAKRAEDVRATQLVKKNRGEALSLAVWRAKIADGY